MGIDTFLVLEPGHMFLGIYLDNAGKQSVCLETTMLGDDDPAKCNENRALAKAASRETRQLKGWKSFQRGAGFRDEGVQEAPQPLRARERSRVRDRGHHLRAQGRHRADWFRAAGAVELDS